MTMSLLPEPELLTGQVIPAAADDQLGLYEKTWTCMVCGAARMFDDVHVAYRPILGLESWFFPDRPSESTRANVRFCWDRSTCAVAARSTAPWPEPMPLLQADNQLQLTLPGLRDKIWDRRDERVESDLARTVLTHLRDEPATVEALVATYSAAAPEVLFDTVRRLIQLAAVGIIPALPERVG